MEDQVLEPVELKTTVTIQDTEFIITPLNAKKTAFVSNLLGKLLIGGKLQLKQLKALDSKDLPMAVLMAVDENMLVSLAATIVGCDENFARDNFNLSWVLEALAIQVQVSDVAGIIRNFTQLASLMA